MYKRGLDSQQRPRYRALDKGPNMVSFDGAQWVITSGEGHPKALGFGEWPQDVITWTCGGQTVEMTIEVPGWEDAAAALQLPSPRAVRFILHHRVW